MSPDQQPTLKYVNEGDICAEIGVMKGDYSAQILKRKPKELHLIDPWVHQDYEKMWYSLPQEEMEKVYRGVKQRFTNDDRVFIHRKFSTETAFSEKYFDWVYIDGDHTYPAVLKDLEFYYPLIKEGGFLCGDDYGWSNVDCRKGGGGPQVAVDEFVTKNALKMKLLGPTKKTQFVIWV